MDAKTTIPKERPGSADVDKAIDAPYPIARIISILTFLAGLFGAYFQYLSAYQDQVREQAKSDMAAATAEFVEISNAYAEAQTLQQRIYAYFMESISDGSDAAGKKMATGAGRATFEHYIKAKVALQQNSDVFARKAQIYIDWPSNPKHDPANTRAMDGDPLTESLLDSYNFECDAPANLPHYVLQQQTNGTDASAAANTSKDDICAAADAPKETVAGSGTLICAIDGSGKVDRSKPSIAINWQSAKHHLLVMYHCFEAAHDAIATARIWASDNDISERRKSEFLASADKHRVSLDNEAARLDDFMNLVMSELQRIEVKYRPVGPFCHVPLLREAIGVFSNRCEPLRTADNPMHWASADMSSRR
jgi:hypothetical protein